jgi:uncharacterized protein DUF4337
MVDPVDAAHEQMEAAHERHGGQESWPRWMAVVVSVLAASLALAELGAKSTQTAYITHNIAASDTWNAYQAKNLRASVWNTQATLLASLPNASDPAVQERIRTAHDQEARMRDEPASGDGMKQLMATAMSLEHERDEVFEHYHGYEHTSSVLQIAIVLASVSVVTRVHGLGIATGAVGLLAILYGLAVFAGFA